MSESIRVNFVDNTGSGLMTEHNINDGTTVEDFLRVNSIVGDNQSAIIRINGLEADRTVVLKEGDRIAVTPTGMKGA